MSRGRQRRSSQPGSPPGHPIAAADAGVSDTTVAWCRYNEALLEEQPASPLEQALRGLDPGVVDWLHFHSIPDPAVLKWLHQQLGLDTLALEDVHNGQQRSKFEPYEGHAFMVVSVPVLRDDSLVLEQFSLFLGPHWVISFWSGEVDFLAPVRQRLRHAGTGRIRRRGADYLAYCLVDLAVDACFPVLESLRDRIESLEEELLDQPRKDIIPEIHGLRRKLAIMRRLVVPGREALEHLLRGDDSPLQPATRIYVRDVLDHQRRIGELIEGLGEHTRSLHELHLMSLNQRMNDVMRLLTIIATIFIPLTFIAGIYGMNFDPEASPWNMPELAMRFGYPAVMLVFAVIGLGMVWMFRRRGWL